MKKTLLSILVALPLVACSLVAHAQQNDYEGNDFEDILNDLPIFQELPDHYKRPKIPDGYVPSHQDYQRSTKYDHLF